MKEKRMAEELTTRRPRRVPRGEALRGLRPPPRTTREAVDMLDEGETKRWVEFLDAHIEELYLPNPRGNAARAKRARAVARLWRQFKNEVGGGAHRGDRV